MSATIAIALKDLAQRVRDRSIFIVGLVAPLALALIFNLIFGGGINDVGQNITLEVGVVDLDAGVVGEAFLGVLTRLSEDGLVEVTAYSDELAGRAAAEGGEVGAVFVLPATLSEDLTSGQDAQITVVGNVDAPTTTEIASAIAGQFALGVRRGNVAALGAMLAGAASPAELPQLAEQAGLAEPALALGVVEAATRQLDASTYFAAGLSVFFLFFIAGMAVTSLLDERREGTLARLLAAPISPGSIVAGKSAASVVIGLAAMATLIVASTLLMDADWGPPIGVVVLVVSVVLAIVAIMTLVGGLAKTAEQAGNLQSIVAVTLGMLGGTFVPISGEGVLAQLSLLTPNAWFLRGLGEMAGGTVADALPAAAVLLALAVVFGTGGLALVRKQVRI